MKWNPVTCDEYGLVVETECSLPVEKREVLIRVNKKTEHGGEWGVVVGYIKHPGGDRSYSGFIIPSSSGNIEAWCDCLPNEFIWPNDKHMEGLKDE